MINLKHKSNNTLTIKVIIRVDDVRDKFDIEDLSEWFIQKYPHIPLCAYIEATNIKCMWGKSGWKLVKNMILKYKWEIGGHTINHWLLTKLANHRLLYEIESNLKDIHNGLKMVGLNYKITSFAYPVGIFNEKVKNVLRLNGIIHGLTYTEDYNFEIQSAILKNKSYEIAISNDASGSIYDWNKKFKKVYTKGGTYILCLHTPHWKKNDNLRNIVRILRSRSIKCLQLSIHRLIYYAKLKENIGHILRSRDSRSLIISILQLKKSLKLKTYNNQWNVLDQHLKYIYSHKNIQFVTFKDIL